jgi:malonate transporter
MANLLGAAGVIFVLVGLGFLARKLHLLRAGDERVLNALVYYFALPAFLLLELAQATYSREILRFVLAGGGPLFLLVLLLGLLRLLRLSRENFYLLSVSTVFGSLAFFGIPFIEYAVGGEEALKLAALSVGLLAPFGVAFVLTLLELHQNQEGPWVQAVGKTLRRLARNPLILSILMGLALGIGKAELPRFFQQILRYLSGTVAPLALFSLGVFLFGRPYKAIPKALGLSLLRLAILPALTLGFARVLGLSSLETTILVIMNGTPLAVNMMVLSQRYGFYVEEIASLALGSSLGSLLTLSLWQLVI